MYCFVYLIGGVNVFILEVGDSSFFRECIVFYIW